MQTKLPILTQNKKKRLKKVAVASALVALCVLLTVFAGIGGYQLAARWRGNDQDPYNPPVISTGTPSGVDPTDVYEVGDVSQYDFAGVVIEKNDGINIYEPGEKVTVGVHPGDVMSYPADAQ